MSLALESIVLPASFGRLLSNDVLDNYPGFAAVRDAVAPSATLQNMVVGQAI